MLSAFDSEKMDKGKVKTMALREPQANTIIIFFFFSCEWERFQTLREAGIAVPKSRISNSTQRRCSWVYIIAWSFIEMQDLTQKKTVRLNIKEAFLANSSPQEELNDLKYDYSLSKNLNIQAKRK